MNLRPYQADDAPALAAIYRDAVLALGPQCYTPAQVRVWAAFADDIVEISRRLAQGLTLVSEDQGRPVAFGQLAPADHLALLYCAPTHMRQGRAGAICDALESHALAQGSPHITTHASAFSRPVFERRGFKLVEVERVIRLGVAFDRPILRKALRNP